MIDKYLRHDSQKHKSKNKFLIKKKDEDELEDYDDYNNINPKIKQEKLTNMNNNFEEQENSIEDLESQNDKKFLMREENEDEDEENSMNRDKNKYSPLKMKHSKKLVNKLDSPLVSLPIKEENTNSNSLMKSNLSRIITNNEPEHNGNNINHNYLNYENLYLNEGEIKKNLDYDTKDGEDLEGDLYRGRNRDYDHLSNKKNTINIPTITSISKDRDILEQNVPNNYYSQLPNFNPKFDGNFRENTSNNENVGSSNSNCYDKNEYKLRRLQEKMEEKIREEYESKIIKKEKEIEKKTQTEFEGAMFTLKVQLEKNLDEEKQKMEDNLQKKWQEKYEDLLIDCKSKLRDDKEQKLTKNMYHKLKPNIEKEIYKNEYNNVELKIRNELESKLNKEMQDKKLQEVERVKRKLEYFTKVKITEMENNIKGKCKDELEIEMKKELEKKEKEMKANYLRKFENFKNTLEKQLKDEYESKKKELVKEIDEMKARVYRQKCAENLKRKNLQNVKNSLINKEKLQQENAERLEKALQSQSLLDYSNSKWNNTTNRKKGKSTSQLKYNRRNENEHNSKNNIEEADSYEKSNFNFNNIQENQKNFAEVQDDEMYANNNSRRISKNNSLSPIPDNRNKNDQSNLSNRFIQNVKSPNSVNLLELNQKFKSFAPTLNSSNINSPHDPKKQLHLLIKDSNNKKNNNFNDNEIYTRSKSSDSDKPENYIEENIENQVQKQIVMKKDIYKLDSPKRLNDDIHQKNKDINNSALIYQTEPQMKNDISSTTDNFLINNLSNKKDTSILNNCLSLKINGTIPTSLLEFGKFLVKYIENEENYRILFEKELKKMKSKIKKLFDDENSSDHCLMDYMIELWDKLEISYCNRYKILVELTKSRTTDIYHFLDKETEYLTDYFQKSQDIIQLISNREKLKSKLQFKANKNQLTADDKEKFKIFTNEIFKKIKLQKEKIGFDTIWKGIYYDWLMNYENWFYERSNH